MTWRRPCFRPACRGALGSAAGQLRAFLAALGLVLLALLLALPAQAQTLESVLSPGPLIKDHAKVEGDCKSCHVRFDRTAQDNLCIACHKEVGADIRNKTGWHGRQPPQACRACHTDHRGREMRIVDFDPKNFDHRVSDYPLRGKHAQVECRLCHQPGKKYRQAPSDCASCHRKDDVHKGSLGPLCADCHTENRWKEAKFDHDTTRFKLTGKHLTATCNACHKTSDYKNTPDTCIGCHRKEDKHKGRYGERCENCHGTKDWPATTFRHDVDTRFSLRGRHREIRCETCHTGVMYRDKTPTACNDCHRKDDKHVGSLGPDCQACHNERRWTETVRFDHDRSTFPLRGAHAKAECRSCHKSPRFREAPSDCLSCHRNDDKHKGTLGTDCASCHTDANWKATRFDHSRTKFPLRGGHTVPPRACADCHRDLVSYRQAPSDCLSCHRKDDKHEGQLGTRCESCHTDRAWKPVVYDHSKARFPLAGAHARVACKDCHTTLRYRDAPQDCFSCHRKHDKHKARFGEDCASCHGVRDWRLWTFDHRKQANYPLEGKHAQVACESCHTKPAPKGRKSAPLDTTCVSCHRRDDIHDGGFGARCEQCHGTTNWKTLTQGRPRATAPTLDRPSRRFFS